MNQEVEAAKVFADVTKGFVNFFLIRYIAREQQRTKHGIVCQIFDVLLQAFALVSEGEVCARFV